MATSGGVAPAGATDEVTVRLRLARAGGRLAAWAVWLVLAADLALYLRAYSPDLPFMDDFQMLPALTGAVPADLGWAWSQHIEHRPFLSRLILVGLWRLVAADFRVARYANLGLLAMMAAALLLATRRLRGHSRPADAVLPLAILNIAQAETLMIGFAMNLVLSSLLAVAPIVAAVVGRGREGRATSRIFALAVVLLPLTGGSGMAILPPLAAWLAVDVASGWWSGGRPGARSRAAGLGALLAAAALIGLYLRGYQPPAQHPFARSPRAVAIGALRFLSLAFHPRVGAFGWLDGLLTPALVTATLGLLAVAAWRRPGERRRATGLMAVILSVLHMAVVVGLSRGGLDPAIPSISRYVTLTSPLLAAVYIAWLAYGPPRLRAVVHALLLALILAAIPHNRRFAEGYGRSLLRAGTRVVQALRTHRPASVVLERACPALFPDRRYTLESLRLMKAARMGPFAELEDDRVASPGEAAGPIRR